MMVFDGKWHLFQLTTWTRVLCDKLLQFYLTNSSHFMDVEGTLPCTLQTALRHILSQISPGQTFPFHFFKIYLNIIFPPKPKPFKWFFSSRFPTNGLHAFFCSPLRATCSFNHPNIWRGRNHEAVSSLLLLPPHMPEYLPEHSSHEHPQPMFFVYCDTKFHTHTR